MTASLTLDTLNPDRLKSAAGQLVYDRGKAYFDWGRAKVEYVHEDSAYCLVQGSRMYQVEIRVSEGYLLLGCTCEYSSNGTVCKHEIAACLAVRSYLRERTPPSWKDLLSQVITAPTAARKSSARPYLLFFKLQPTTSYSGTTFWKLLPYTLPVLSLPREQRGPEIIRDPQSLTSLIVNNHLGEAAKSPYNSLDPAACQNCGPETVILANLLIERSRSYSYSAFSYTVSPVPLDHYLSLLANTHGLIFLGDTGNPLKTPLTVLQAPAEFQIRIQKDDQNITLLPQLKVGSATYPVSAQSKTPLELISINPPWLLIDNQLVRLNTESVSPLMAWQKQRELVIPRGEEADFLSRFYLSLVQQQPVVGDDITWETISAEPVPRLYLSDSRGSLRSQLRFGYGDYEVPYESSPSAEKIINKPDSWGLVRIQRNLEAEENAFRKLSTSAYRLKRGPKTAPPGVFVLRANAHPIDFLLHSIPRLVQDGFEIYGEEKLKTIQVNRNRPVLSVKVSSGIDWFDVQTIVNFGDIEVSFKELRRAIRKRERYIKLADGSIGEIPADWVERYRHLFSLGEETENGLRLSNHHVTLLDQLLEETEQAQVDEEFEKRRLALRSFSGIRPVPLPQRLRGELRPYQKAGYDWLHFLREYGFGGCLADDMGLGKTIQVLALLQSIKEGMGCSQDNGSSQHRPASLVVVPRSLLANWQREVRRFTPELSILEYFDKDRPKDPAAFDSYDLIITTYGIMLRDIQDLVRYTFDYVILDESQAIKNPSAQTARAARALRGRHRLALTGTPMENSSVELWSQFAFLNPGLLGSLDYFQSEFSTPIEKKGDKKTAEYLRKLVYPFILRRTKKQVAPELPPRTERLLYSDMEPNQRKLYNRTRDYYRGVVMGLLEKEGLQNSRMKILEGLLRLRQISNHPRLVDPNFRGEAGKFELLVETLETLRLEGHKILVFSQFVQMLRLLRERLDQQEIPYAYLDGHTRNRQEVVDSFQNDPDLPFFLISLRAGGTGLNLTAADYVIHIDPWWNPAVEMQATDRAHRIGQDKPVFVYKLITRDSVEEKILQLQEQKRNLVEQFITAEGGFFKSITVDDVKILFGA
jgi:non-specific serine/threonine protein kinase